LLPELPNETNYPSFRASAQEFLLFPLTAQPQTTKD
jgi:hypothetical protein